MGEQSDPRREMEACRMASIEPATKQANRGGGTGAVGGSHGDRRADSESGSCRHAASVDRASDPAAACLFLWVGSVCVKTHWVGDIAQAHDVATSGGSPQRASRASPRRSVAAARTNIGEYKRSSVWLCCTLLPLCISARRAGAKRSLYRGRRPPPRHDTAAARW
jgi:hypothetical protein